MFDSTEPGGVPRKVTRVAGESDHKLKLKSGAGIGEPVTLCNLMDLQTIIEEKILGILTKVRARLILEQKQYQYFWKWLGEFLRESSVLVAVFLGIERWLKPEGTVTLQQKVVTACLVVGLFLVGTKVGLWGKLD